MASRKSSTTTTGSAAAVDRKRRNTALRKASSCIATVSDASNVKVFCRIRPINSIEAEKSSNNTCISQTTQDAESVQLETREGELHQFTYDYVFGPTDSQESVFTKVASNVTKDVLQGYNSTIFAYGQTSSGKTFTMEGEENNEGIIPRTSEKLFQDIQASDENLEFIVRVSYIEIYMERIRDLLNPVKSNLQVREGGKKGIYVADVTELCVCSAEELIKVLRTGRSNRAVAATGMNEGSSRSHSVLTISVIQHHLKDQTTSKAGKLVLVDLAGSEMVRKTRASGQQMEEAKMINKSLSALGQVINALTDGSVSHVPYRDSKLTRLLSQSIGGNARTALIVNVSPSSYNESETLSTLRFGKRAKAIKNKAIINEDKSPEEFKTLLAAAADKISKQEIEIASLSTNSNDALQMKISELEVELQQERLESTQKTKTIETLEAALLAKDDSEGSPKNSDMLEAENLSLKLQELQLHSDGLARENDRLRQELLDNVKGTGALEISSTSTSNNNRNHVSHLSQRLSQLILVHRKLLRQYAALELKSEEYCHTMQIREERVTILEKEIKLLSGTMRIQKERHARELQRIIPEKYDGDKFFSQAAGHHNNIRSIRGGGKKITSSSSTNGGTGYFSRIFDKNVFS